MKLLFITNAYPPYTLGGYDQICEGVRSRLEREGHTIHVLTSNHRVSEGPPQEQRVTRTLRLMADLWHYRPIDFLLFDRANERHNCRQVERAIEQIDPDLVVVWGMWDLSQSVAKRAETLVPERVAYFVSSYWPIDQDIHEYYWSTDARGSLAGSLKRWVGCLAMSDYRRRGLPAQLDLRRIACCSEYVRSKLLSSGVEPIESRVIYNGISFQDFTGQLVAHDTGPLELVIWQLPVGQ